MQVPPLILESPLDVRRFFNAKRIKEKRAKIDLILHHESKGLTDEEIELINTRCFIRLYFFK